MTISVILNCIYFGTWCTYRRSCFVFCFSFTQQIKSSCLSLFVKVKFWRTCLSGTPPPQPWTPPSRCGSSCSTCWRTSGSVTWSPGQVKMESSSCWTLKRSHVCGGSARTNTTWTTTNWAEHCDTTTTRYHWWCHDILNTAGGKSQVSSGNDIFWFSSAAAIEKMNK